MKRIFQIVTILAIVISSLAAAPVAARLGNGLGLAAAPNPPPPLLFLPFISRHTTTYAITGRVTNDQNTPLGGVTIIDQYGHSVITNPDGTYVISGLASGYYALSPSRQGAIFSPAIADVTLTASNGSADFKWLTACREGVVDGGFEASQAWDLSQADYSTAVVFSGARALRTGNLNTTNNQAGYSYGRQTLSIPSGTAGATLRLWLYPLSGDVAVTGLIDQANLPTIDTATASDDAQYLLVRDSSNNLLETLLWMRSNDQKWGPYQFNLSKYAGQTITLEGGTYNDGLGGVTAMYVDDFSVELCDFSTAAPEQPTQPCDQHFGNSGFEVNGSWGIPVTAYPAGYSTYVAHAGTRSMRTGIIYTKANKESYSDAYQQTTIPDNATSIALNMWIYPITGDSTSMALPEVPLEGKFGEAPLASDLQYVVTLNKDGNIIEWLYKDLTDTQTWTQLTFNLDVSRYRGKTIRIQVGTYNTGLGDVSSMFVDDATLDVCAAAPVPTATATTPPPTATPTSPPPTAVPTPPNPTPTAGPCTERIKNNGFEATSDWGIPATAFTAGYSTANAHTGVRSMRNGIIRTAQNKYSYSDAYQVTSIASLKTSATLSMWIYPISPAANDKDLQYVLILDRYGNWIGTLLMERSNTKVWTLHQFNLAQYIGTTIRLQFGVYNNGLGDVTAMYVDDVSLQTCP
jgi:Carboxypeptidase regulatory-like domain